MIGLLYCTCVFLVTRPFSWYDNFWPRDLDLEVWPAFEKLESLLLFSDGCCPASVVVFWHLRSDSFPHEPRKNTLIPYVVCMCKGAPNIITIILSITEAVYRYHPVCLHVCTGARSVVESSVLGGRVLPRRTEGNTTALRATVRGKYSYGDETGIWGQGSEPSNKDQKCRLEVMLEECTCQGWFFSPMGWKMLSLCCLHVCLLFT